MGVLPDQETEVCPGALRRNYLHRYCPIVGAKTVVGRK